MNCCLLSYDTSDVYLAFFIVHIFACIEDLQSNEVDLRNGWPLLLYTDTDFTVSELCWNSHSSPDIVE